MCIMRREKIGKKIWRSCERDLLYDVYIAETIKSMNTGRNKIYSTKRLAFNNHGSPIRHHLSKPRLPVLTFAIGSLLSVPANNFYLEYSIAPILDVLDLKLKIYICVYMKN